MSFVSPSPRPTAIALGVCLAACSLATEATAAPELQVAVVRDAATPAFEFQPPDLTPYAIENLRAGPDTSEPGTVNVIAAEGIRLLEEALRRGRGNDLRKRQASETLRVIEVTGGRVTLGALVDAVGDPALAARDASAVTLRLPVLVREGASLVIDGAQTPVVRLSTDRGAFLANGGTLSVIDTEVVGWDEASGVPSEFQDKTAFRPFLASFIRSETHLIGSRFRCLGFAAPTAYGISLTTQPERKHGEPTEDSPTGMIVGNTFENLYYGFYSFEARDVAIVDNLYDDSIVYAIDPHDRTTRLLIARNETRRTRQRHGIIGSRGVSDSLVYDNVAHDNGGSGIMLDRECTGVTVVGNRVYDNKQGIAVYESDGNRILDNLIADNASSGLRVRNSIDVVAARNTILNHGDYAFDISGRRLDDHDRRLARGDAYDTRVEVTLVDSRLLGNRGVLKGSGLGVLKLRGVSRAAPSKEGMLGIDQRAAFTPRYADREREFGGDVKAIRGRLDTVFSEPETTVVITPNP